MNSARKAARLSIDQHRRKLWLTTLSNEEIISEMTYRGLVHYRSVNLAQIEEAKRLGYGAGFDAGAAMVEANAMEAARRELQQLERRRPTLPPMVRRPLKQKWWWIFA